MRVRNRKKIQILLGGVLGLGAVIGFTALCLGVLLKNGIRFDEVAVGPVAASNLELVWRDRLELEIASLKISPPGETPSPSTRRNYYQSTVQSLRLLETLFSKLIIQKIVVGKIVAAIQVTRDRDQTLRCGLTSKYVTLKAHLRLLPNAIRLNISEFSSRNYHSSATGDVLFDAVRREIRASFAANIADCLPVTLEAVADDYGVSFQGRERGRTTTITPLVDMLGLPPKIQRWITGNLKGDRFHLKEFQGEIPWDSPGKILETLRAEVRVDHCEYRFAPGLEPIKAAFVDVVFQKGILNITPHESTFYGQSGGTSRLDLNFNDPANIILTARIRTRAILNQDILTLLEHYRIRLPFRQSAGDTETDLTLTIHLNQAKFDVKGSLGVENGMIEYGGGCYHVENVLISLNNSNVAIEHLTVSLKTLFEATVTGKLQTAEGTGDLDIRIRQADLEFGASHLKLDESNPAPLVKYHIRPENHTLEVSASSWRLDQTELNLGAFVFPFDLHTLAGRLAPVRLQASFGGTAIVGGDVSLKDKTADLDFESVMLERKNLVLTSPHIPFSIRINQGVTLWTRKVIHLKVNQLPVTLYPLEARYRDALLTLAKGRLVYGDLIDTEIEGRYDFSAALGNCRLICLHLKGQNIERFFALENGLNVNIAAGPQNLILKVPELDLEAMVDGKKNWSVNFASLKTLARRSAFLRRLKLESGHLTISSRNGREPYYLTGNLQSGYPILVKDQLPINQLLLSGIITAGKLVLTVNQDLKVNISSAGWRARSDHLEYNVPAIVEVIRNYAASAPKTSNGTLSKADGKKNIIFSLDAAHTGLFLKPGSRAPADRLHLNYAAGKADLRLEYDGGHIVMHLAGNHFMVEGRELSHDFIHALIQESDLKEGRMAFAANGTFDEFVLLVKVNDIIIKNLKTLNNILAFLNTVPALVTFSLPQYSTKGLPITAFVAGMQVKQEVATFKSLWLDSPELSMTGKGWLDFDKKRMDLDLNVTTRAQTNVRKIPLLGYLLTGDKNSNSLTLAVTGKINDPMVKTSLARDIVKIPLDILWRALKLPAEIAKSITEP